MDTSLLTLNPGNHATRYLHLKGSEIIATSTLAEMLQTLGKKFQPKLNTTALSHLLHHSVSPYPHTIYQGIHSLGVGDTATLSPVGITVTNSMPYMPEKSRQDQSPSTQHLLNLLCASLTTGLANNNATLMLSSGKDSIALALAANRSGLQSRLTTVTYAEEGAASEGGIASQMAKKFGLKYRSITLPTDTKIIQQALTTFFTNAAQPSLDPVTPAYVLALHAAELSNSVLLDGTGNDHYMGILPPSNKHLVHKATVGRFAAAQWLNNLVPFYHPLAKYLRPQSDHVVLGRLALRHQETRRIFAASEPTNAFWNTYDEDPRLNLTYMHFFNHLRGYAYDGAHTTRAREELAHAGNNRLLLPWLNADIATYCFNLPEAERFSLQSGKNKIILRKMLLEFADYDADAVGKRIFSFNQPQFLLNNQKFVREEILSCKLWQPEVTAFVEKLFKILPHKPQSRYGLMELFLISGWHNHSKYLNA